MNKFKDDHEFRRAYHRHYYRENKDRWEMSDTDKAEKAAYLLAYRERHRNSLKAKAQSLEGRLKKRQRQKNRETRKMGQFVEDVDHLLVFVMNGGRCGICGGAIDGDFHVDHVIPLSKGGLHGYMNVQPAHPFCNLSKHNKE